jgi:hypothetical protein
MGQRQVKTMALETSSGKASKMTFSVSPAAPACLPACLPAACCALRDSTMTVP